MSFLSIDPIAQSFIVEEPMLVTKVDVFFKEKDASLPMYIQLREMDNGQPSDEIIPQSEVFVYPANVNTSTDSSVATPIEFNAPIYLDVGEYAFCVGAGSNDYKLFISELDETDLVTSKSISDQPYVGHMYTRDPSKKPETGTGFIPWTKVENQDIKFNIYKGEYDTGASATVDFTVKMNDSLNYNGLEVDPFEIYVGSDQMWVYHDNHGMTDGSYVRFTGVEGSRNFDGTQNTIFGINMATFVGVDFAIANASDRGYSITLPAAVSGITTTTRFGGSVVHATQNFKFDAIYPAMVTVEDADVKITRAVKTTDTSYNVDAGFTVIQPGTNSLAKPGIIAGPATTDNNLLGAESFTYRVTLETTNTNVSPMVDVSKLGIVGIQNIVNDPTYANQIAMAEQVIPFITATSLTITQQPTNSTHGTFPVALTADQNVAKTLVLGSYLNLTGGANTGQYRIVDIASDGTSVEIASTNGTDITTDTATYTMTNGVGFVADEAAQSVSNDSQYITRKIDFTNPSTSLNIRLDVNVPSESDIKLYYKTGLVGSSEDLSLKEFKAIPYTMPVALNDTDFTEIELQRDDLTAFESLMFKVVFKSTNTARVARCKNLRLIALA